MQEQKYYYTMELSFKNISDEHDSMFKLSTYHLKNEFEKKISELRMSEGLVEMAVLLCEVREEK